MRVQRALTTTDRSIGRFDSRSRVKGSAVRTFFDERTRCPTSVRSNNLIFKMRVVCLTRLLTRPDFFVGPLTNCSALRRPGTWRGRDPQGLRDGQVADLKRDGLRPEHA